MRFPYTTPFRSRRTAAKKEPARLRALTLLPRALARFVGQRPSVGRRLSDRRHGDDFPVLLRRHDRSAKVPGQRRPKLRHLAIVGGRARADLGRVGWRSRKQNHRRLGTLWLPPTN